MGTFLKNMLARKLDRQAPFLATVTGIALAFVVPIIIAMMTPESLYGEEWGVIASCVIGGLMVAFVTGSAQRRPFQMVTWVFIYVFLGIAPLVQIRMNVDPSTTRGLQDSLFGDASLIVLAAAAATIVGVFLARPSGQQEDQAEVQLRRSTVRAYLLSLVSLALFAYYASKVGPANLFASRADLQTIRELVWPDKTVNAVIGAGSSMGLLVSMISLIHLRQQQKVDGARRAFFFPLVVFVALVVCVNPISTPRYIFGTAALALLAATGLYRTLARFRLVTLAFVASLIFVFPILDAFRNSLSEVSVDTSALDSLLSGDFDAFAQIVNTVEYVQRNGITNGNQLMGVIFFWVPRSFWPDKAVDTGTLLANMKGYWFTNLSAPLPAELFINGGWAALIVGMLVFGFAIRRWDSSMNRMITKGQAPSILGCIMPFYMLILLRGSLLQAVAYMAVILASAAFVAPRKVRDAPRPTCRSGRADSGLQYAKAMARR
ncbi:hypothetical protein ACTHQ6_00765 [Arthrobacter sp. SAFR-179]|uniref:hypothetical protein n=1 Tax=Arthrobacter sp. SAFR-179 TaxID=3387279 RepID=UPI003F7BD9E9